MQSRRQLRAGQAIRNADLAKPDLVTRDQAVTLIYETSGLYLTLRGKAIEGGTEGDVVNVINLQSKRTVSGVIVGRGQVAVSAPTPRLPAQVEAPAPTPVPTRESPSSEKISQARPPLVDSPAATSPVALAANDHVPVSRKAE
jgi:flagella basal body P-ring formation protein FlgA